MTYCSDCIHYKVCGNEGVDDSAMTYCKDKIEQADKNLISIESVITMLQKICNSIDDGNGFNLNEWVDYAKQIPSAEKTTLRTGKTTITDGDLISRDFMKEMGATCIAKRSKTGELVAISSIDNLPSAEKTDRVITELEKITESIKEIKGDNKYVVSDYMCGAYEAFDVVFDIIKDRIAELKGDKKWESVKY